MANELRFSLLGGLRITEGEAPLPSTTPHKGQALLCYLALTRRPQTRDALANLLWSDDPQEEARASLRNVLSLLRKVASPHLLVTRHTVAFNFQSPYWLDVEVFCDKIAVANTALAKGDPGVLATLREAMDLYGGEFLEGIYVPGAPVFEEWVLTERQWLHGMAIEALHRLASESAHQGNATEAIIYLNRLLVLEPWREEARRDLMRLLAETGRRSAALAEYETCRRILLTELGVEPGEETVALYKQILAGRIGRRALEIAQPALKPLTRPPGNLPASLTPLFGRDMELSQLVDRLQRPDLRLLTLVGEGGIGKTRLATELASRLLSAFPDGVFFVALSALHDVELVPSAIAQAVNLHEGRGRSYLDALKAWLAERKVLLVLDNFEQILDATGTVVELLQAAPELKVLVTSREPLATTGEHVFPVQPLPVPDPQHDRALESLDQYSSIALFCARAEAVRFGFALTEDNAPSIADICRRLDGSPLAIELAAAQAGGFEVDEIARRLNDRFRFLVKGNRAAPERHRTLLACIEWSCDLLGEEDRHLFRRLSVFAGGWTMEAAVAVCGGTGLRPTMDDEASIVLSETEISGGTKRLVDKSLVVLDPETGRYRMHESLREYAAGRLEDAGEAEDLRALHLNYFTELAEEAEQQLTGPEPAKWLDTLDAEHDNLRAGFDWLQGRTGKPQENPAAVMRLAGALWRFWLMRGYTEEGSRRLESVLAANAAAEAHLTELSSGPLLTAWSKALTGAGAMVEARGGDYSGARSYMERTLAVRRLLGDKKGIASALNNLAIAVKGGGDLALARQLTEESLNLKRELGDNVGIANSLSNLGNIAFDQGDYSAACSFHEGSVVLARELGYPQSLATKLHNFGGALLVMGELDRAGALFEESLALTRELNDRPGIGRALGSLGQLAADQGDFARALSLQKESLEEFRQAGHLREISENLADIALALGALGHRADAERLMGASEAARVATRYQLTPADRARIERGLARIRSETQIDPSRLEAAYIEGLAMTLNQAIAAALEAPAAREQPG
jgi:predicted ATPase/DNA-binding SARP family transcriptional activator